MDPPPAADILLVTGSRMPVPDPESGLLVAALADRGVRAELIAWDAPADWAAAALVVLRTPWDYVSRHEQFLAWLRGTAAATTVVNDAELVAWNIHIDLVTSADGPLLMEAELIEPELFLPCDPGAAPRFAHVLAKLLARRRVQADG